MPDDHPASQQDTSGVPNPRVGIPILVGGMMTIVVWLIKAIWKIDIPAEVAAAGTTVISGLAGYFTPRYLW